MPTTCLMGVYQLQWETGSEPLVGEHFLCLGLDS